MGKVPYPDEAVLESEVYKMTVRDLLAIDEVSTDVCDDYDERCYIAYESGYELTDAGRARFADALDIPITAITDFVGLHCESGKEAQACKELFESMAGLCTCDEFDAWFIER